MTIYDSEELKMGAESRGVVLAIGIEFDPKKVGVALLSCGLERSAESRHGAITSTKIGEDDKVRVSVRSASRHALHIEVGKVESQFLIFSSDKVVIADSIFGIESGEVGTVYRSIGEFTARNFKGTIVLSINVSDGDPIIFSKDVVDFKAVLRVHW